MSKARKKSPVRELVETIVLALVIALAIRYLVVEVYVVDGPSMQDTLHTDERLLVNKFIYRISDPTPGDIVVFRFPGDLAGAKGPVWWYCLTHECRNFVKRAVAVGGDTVEIRDGAVFVNGQPFPDPPLVHRGHGNMSPFPVPQGTVFVMGDNRPNSEDSRMFGPVPLQLVRGEALLRFWPLGQWRVLTAGP